MGTRHIFAIVLILTLPCLFLLLGKSEGFNDNAHKALSERAVLPGLPNASQLDNFLKTALGFEFPSGINQPLLGGPDGTVVGLIKFGAVSEDRPASRVLNHFHDPTRPWNMAGFKGQYPSSIVWSQLAFQQVGITRTWKIARDSYFNALMSTTESERKRWYVETFRTLGHLIHHVQDAAAPTHTRDESHLALFRTMLPDGDPFHDWADRDAGITRINQSQPLRFDASLLNQASANQYAPIPFARITDSTDGDIGSFALVPGLSLGLAEYSNANFISKGTSRSTKYQSPRMSQLQFGDVETLPGGKLVRYARFLQGIGEQDYRIGRSSRMVLFVNRTNVPDALDFGLDDNVHDDYGRKLFPRAIGYSADLIDYFFRGKIKIEAPDRYVYSLAEYVNGNAGFFTKMKFKVSNDTSYPSTSEDTTGLGEIQAIVRYRKALSGDLIVNPYGGLTEPFYAFSEPKTVSLTRASVEHTFDFTGDNRIPTNAGDISLMVVWRGKLGQEDGAIMLGGKNLREPDAFDSGNVSDYDCYQNNIYTVTQPSIQTADRDVDDDNIMDLFGPAKETNVYVMVFPGVGPVPSRGDILQKYHFKLNTTTYAQYGRFMMLQEGDTFGLATLAETVEDEFTHSVSTNSLSIYYFAGIWNEFNESGVPIISPSFVYRGVPMLHAVVRLASLVMRNSPACLSQLQFATPNMTRITDPTIVAVHEY